MAKKTANTSETQTSETDMTQANPETMTLEDFLASMPVILTRNKDIPTEINPSDLPPETVSAALVYGVRRLVQDSVNSQIHQIKTAAKDEGKPEPEIDVKKIVNDRIEQLLSGNLNVRSATGTSDPLDPFRIQAVRKVIKDGSENDKALKEIPAKDQAARNAFLLDLASKHAEAIDPIAKELQKIADMRKKAADSASVQL